MTKTFIDEKEDEIKKEGIVIFDRVTRMPSYNEPYNSPHFVICINHSGSVKLDHDMGSDIFSPHGLAILYPSHSITAYESSEDYCFTLIVVSKEMFGTMSNRIIHRNRFKYVMHPQFKLSDSQYEDVMSIVEAMKRVVNIKTESRREMMVGLHDILMQMIDIFRKENNGEEPDYLNTSSHNLSPQFYEAVEHNYAQHHDVDFYANLFCLTPKHFSAIIKSETGYCASHWLHTYIINEAKLMLRSDSDSSIMDVSNRMGFSDQASFSRYFKRETGLTPKEYRWKAKKEQ